MAGRAKSAQVAARLPPPGTGGAKGGAILSQPFFFFLLPRRMWKEWRDTKENKSRLTVRMLAQVRHHRLQVVPRRPRGGPARPVGAVVAQPPAPQRELLGKREVRVQLRGAAALGEPLEAAEVQEEDAREAVQAHALLGGARGRRGRGLVAFCVFVLRVCV